MGFQRFEQVRFASKSALLRKASERLPEQRLSPFAIVNSIRPPAFVARDLVFRFRNGRLIEWLADFSAAPPLRLLAIARMSDEMFERAEEKGAETSLLAISPEAGAIPNKFGEKSLRQILRILGSDPLASQEKIKGPPINAAKLGKCFECVRGRNGRSSSGENDCPTRGSKPSVARDGVAQCGRHAAFLPAARKNCKEVTRSEPNEAQN